MITSINELNSLEHCPKISKDLHCFDNAIKFSEEYIRFVTSVGEEICN